MRASNPVMNVFSPLLLALATAAIAGLAAVTPVQTMAVATAPAPVSATLSA